MTILLLAAVVAMAADASGKWMFEQQGRGGNTMQVTLTLKVDGAALTGTVSQPGRGGETMETAITDGKVDGNNISFTVKREFNGNSFVITYKGVLDGDTLKLDITRPGRGGGEPRTDSVTAKRSQ